MRGRAIGAVLSLAVVLGLAACAPTPAPTPRPRALERRSYVPQVIVLPYAVWRHPPRYRLGVAAAAARTEDDVRRLADLGVFSIDNWSASLTVARAAARVGIVYYPRLHIIARYSAADRDGVVQEPHLDLDRCEPASAATASVRFLAREFPGTLWSLFNEPDNLDPTAGSGCWDATVGGEGYTGYDGDPALTGPRYAYRQAATVVRFWVQEVRAVDAEARFDCCGELWGQTAAYVRGVADAYRELYGERIPLDAVSLHIYQVNNWDLASYQALLRQAIAAVDTHPDLRGLPIRLNEGISLSLSSANAPKDAVLLHEWYDWLGLPENDRIQATAWWVDYVDLAVDGKREVGARLFEGRPIATAPLSAVGRTWQSYACRWIDGYRDAAPLPCPPQWWNAY